MRSKVVDIAHAMASSSDAKATLRSAVGSLSGIEVLHNLVLVATYVKPERTAGGIFLPDKSKDEDRYQGKVGLVLARGPIAFKDDAYNNFGGSEADVGDWVVYWPSDGREMFLNGVSCRLLEDKHIRMRIGKPEGVF